ncbi:hypothetical protein [Cellulosimicrobium funkei]|uniref:hypothetical protein n=1 Tax=Cellulosimicrobium funkei TaxID=264251 RepID=UPI003D751991
MTVVAGTFRVVPAWLAVGGVLVLERLVTVWRNGPRGRLLAVLVLPELLYDLFLQVAFVRACFLAATSRDAGWHHVVHATVPGSATEDAPETGPASSIENTESPKQLTLT